MEVLLDLLDCTLNTPLSLLVSGSEASVRSCVSIELSFSFSAEGKRYH
ncbi:MAG: hypothetical protein PV345_01930 [Wolbachia sp.]|nr:hypothetical protein [Wolbachia sp.]